MRPTMSPWQAAELADRNGWWAGTNLGLRITVSFRRGGEAAIAVWDGQLVELDLYSPDDEWGNLTRTIRTRRPQVLRALLTRPPGSTPEPWTAKGERALRLLAAREPRERRLGVCSRSS